MNKWISGVTSNHADTNANQGWLNLAEARRGGREDRAWDSYQFTDYDMVGIAASKIPDVKAAINTYVTRIEKDLEKLGESHKNIDKAFQGQETQEALKAYINHVRDYCVNVTSHLLEYSNKLTEIENTWNLNQQKLASNINESGSFDIGSKMTDPSGSQK